MRTLLYIFSVRNALKRKKDLFSLKRSATWAMVKNNLLKLQIAECPPLHEIIAHNKVKRIWIFLHQTGYVSTIK